MQKDYLHHDDEINNNNHDEEGLSALLIDPIRAFGEVIDTFDNTNGNEYEEIVMEHDVDDDEEDA